MGNSLKKRARGTSDGNSNTNEAAPKNVIMVGLDGCGLTSILRRLNAPNIETHQPIDGVSVQTVKYRNLNIHAWHIGIADEHTRNEWESLLQTIYSHVDGLVFVVDSTDKHRIDNEESFFWDTSQRHLDMLLSAPKYKKFLGDAALLVLATQQQSPAAMSVDCIAHKLDLHTLRNRQWSIYGTTVHMADDDDDGIETAFRWLLDTVNHNKFYIASELKSILLVSGYVRLLDAQYTLLCAIPVEVVKFIHLLYKNPDYDHNSYAFYGEYATATKNSHQQDNECILLMQFLNRQDDCATYIADDEQFIDSLQGGKHALTEAEDKWNHYNFMRMIWICFALYDRRKGLQKIWQYTPYNVTKTYFWAQLIHFGMHRNSSNDSSDLTRKKFQYFLVMNPSFSNDWDVLMSRYYSQPLLQKMEHEKRDEMLLPDLVKLPSLITNVKKVKVAVKIGHYQRFKDTDEEFLQRFETKTFKSWEGHTSFLRVIWCYLKTLKAQPISIIQQKWKAFDGHNYNMTKTYFWIHMMRFYMQEYRRHLSTVQHNKQEKLGSEEEKKQQQDMYTFQGFLDFCAQTSKCRIEYDEWWREYYSERLIQKTDHDKLAFPNLKQLPNI